MSKSIKKNSIYSILKTFSSIVFPLITFPYVSRVLLTENVGKINFGLSIVSYFTLIASLGVSTYAIRECSSVRDNKVSLEKTASQIFSINVITTIVAYICLAITLASYRKLDSYRLLIIIQSLSIIATTLGADWLNSAMEDFKFITIRTVSFQIVSLGLLFAFVHKPDDYIKYAIISLISSAGASITNIWYRRRYCKVTFTLKIDWKRHMPPIMFLFVMILAQTIFNSVDSTMLGLIQGDYEVGIYSAAHKVLNIINQVIGSLLWVIMPRMAYYFADEDYDSINKLLKKILQFNITVGLPCVVGVIVIAKDIICIVAGQSFVEATPVLQIFMFGFVFSLFGGSFLGNAVLLPSKKEKYYMIVCCIAAVINIITNYFAIPVWGARAAAGTTALCSITIMVLLMFKVDKRISINGLWKLFISPVIGCLLIIAICLISRPINNLFFRAIVSIGTSAIIYFVIQILFKNELIIDLLNEFRRKMLKA